jgi:dethiobiotin synthetase
LRPVTTHIRSFATRCELLLVEGAGGLLAPLGENKSKPYSNLTLLKTLDCEAIVVAPNKLGTINHTLLTLDRLKHEDVKVRTLLLSDLTSNPVRHDPSAHHNHALLKELLPSISIHQLPFLGPALDPASVVRSARKQVRLLAQILGKWPWNSI